MKPADSLSRKWAKAKEGVHDTKLAFDQLTKRLEASSIEEWTAQEHVAMEQRGERLKIYDVVSNNGTGINFYIVVYRTHAMQYARCRKYV